MHVLIICMNSKDPIKNEDATVAILYINFSDAQWRLTPYLLAGSGRSSHSSKLLCRSLLRARMKIQSKIKLLEWPHNFSHYKSMGIFPDPQGQRLICQFFRRSMADNSVVRGAIWPKFKLIQAFIHVLDTCKNEGQMKN